MAYTALWFFFLFISCSLIDTAYGDCNFPPEYGGNWYHRETGQDENLMVQTNPGKWGEDLICEDIILHPNLISTEGVNSTILLRGKSVKCCLDIIFRSENILQFQMGECLTHATIDSCSGKVKLPEHTELTTMFKMMKPIDCIASMEGTYQFSYEVSHMGGGICNSSRNVLEACQAPGSPYYDNKAFRMTFHTCPDISNSYNKETRFQCMGTWTANIGQSLYTFIALSDSVMGNIQDKFKCLMTRRDQQAQDNTIRWGLSRFGDCRQLKSLDFSPIRIVLRRILPSTNYMIPQCTFPRNLRGFWFTQGLQFASHVWVNDTHMRYMTQKNQFDYDDSWFSCQARKGTRYLVTKTVVGRCEVNLVCFDLVPRHHSIVRYRVGRPVAVPITGENYFHRDEEFVASAFRQACSWEWITFKRDNTHWKYEVLIQDPPSPVVCPVAGRYYFEQYTHDPFQLYYTRIRGFTARPRNRIRCLHNVSEFKSCSSDRSRLEVDTEYCETVDYRGRPIGEYEEPDHVLTCAGYWLEDMKSYLVTYDEEDPVSRFRCWVYERISWTEVAMSRAETARCPREQNSTSYLIEGARLYLHLTESERLFDDCAPGFDSGIDPEVKPMTIYRLDDSLASVTQPGTAILWLSIIVCGLCASLT